MTMKELMTRTAVDNAYIDYEHYGFITKVNAEFLKEVKEDQDPNAKFWRVVNEYDDINFHVAVQTALIQLAKES